jgi:dihydrofolate reductase
MRRVRYAVAMSLDGYIAGPNGEADWIIMDPEIDFQVLFEQFDTFLMGRRTFEGMGGAGGSGQPGVQTIVFSRTLRQQDYPNLTIVSENPELALAELRAKPGKDIWLFGGGSLFRSLLEARVVSRPPRTRRRDDRAANCIGARPARRRRQGRQTLLYASP